jgi:hypothetical protein
MGWKINRDKFLRDFRYTIRNLRKDRRFAFIAIFTLALGIGASTVVFSVVYNVPAFRSLIRGHLLPS